MNLPLLYWAAEQTGDVTYRQIARRHARTTQRHIVRAEGSTYHTSSLIPGRVSRWGVKPTRAMPTNPCGPGSSLGSDN